MQKSSKKEELKAVAEHDAEPILEELGQLYEQRLAIIERMSYFDICIVEIDGRAPHTLAVCRTPNPTGLQLIGFTNESASPEDVKRPSASTPIQHECRIVRTERELELNASRLVIVGPAESLSRLGSPIIAADGVVAIYQRAKPRIDQPPSKKEFDAVVMQRLFEFADSMIPR